MELRRALGVQIEGAPEAAPRPARAAGQHRAHPGLARHHPQDARRLQVVERVQHDRVGHDHGHAVSYGRLLKNPPYFRVLRVLRCSSCSLSLLSLDFGHSGANKLEHESEHIRTAITMNRSATPYAAAAGGRLDPRTQPLAGGGAWSGT